MNTEHEDTDDFGTSEVITVRDWFDILGQFFYRLGVTAVGFGVVILAATLLTKWLVIPVLRAKGWCV